MSKTKVIWDYAAAGDLMLRSQAVADFCDAEAEKRTKATGMEYKADVHYGKTRVNAAGYDAKKDDEGDYRTRSNGKVVYTQKKVEKTK